MFVVHVLYILSNNAFRGFMLEFDNFPFSTNAFDFDSYMLIKRKCIHVQYMQEKFQMLLCTDFISMSHLNPYLSFVIESI